MCNFSKYSVLIKDVLTVQCDIIVISANPSLIARSGISEIIQKAAGPKLEAAAKPFAPLTPAFNLPAKYIIHTMN